MSTCQIFNTEVCYGSELANDAELATPFQALLIIPATLEEISIGYLYFSAIPLIHIARLEALATNPESHAVQTESFAAWVEMVFILIAGYEIVIAGLAVIIACLAITISCHEPNFTVGSGEMGLGSGGMGLGLGEMGMVADEMAVATGISAADSGILPAGAILVGVMGDGMGMGAASGAIVRVATAQIIEAAGCNCL